MLDMMFGNLMDNAIKYGGQDPRVEIRSQSPRKDKIEIQICDNGPGVPPEIRPEIFKLFYRGEDELQRTKTGTGVGLYVAHTLVGSAR